MILRDTQWHLCSNGTLHTSKIHLKVVVRISLIRVWSSLSLGWSSDGFLPSVYWEEPTALQGQGMSSHWQSPGWWWELHIKFCLPCNSLDLYEWFIGSMYSSTPIILNKAKHLAASFAWDNSPCLPVTWWGWVLAKLCPVHCIAFGISCNRENCGVCI